MSILKRTPTHFNLRMEEIIRRLKERGYRLTPQRLEIIKILLTEKRHPSAEQIYEQVKADFPMTSLATVYKTIALLKEMGEVMELPCPQEGSRYDGQQHHPHPHVVCIRCNEILDSLPLPLERFAEEIAHATGYQIVGQRLDFLGICPKCQEKEQLTFSKNS